MGMTLEELRDYVDQQRDLDNIPYHVYSTLIDGIDTLEQEPIDYKTQYENYLKKSEVVISQLRAERDRLQDAFDKLRAEIEQNAYPIVHGVNNHEKGMTLYGILQVIDKYKAEVELQESENKKEETEYQRQVEQYQYDTLYEPTFDLENGSM